MDKVTVANFINLANNMVGSGLIPTGEANYELAKEYATQQSRIDAVNFAKWLSLHCYDKSAADVFYSWNIAEDEWLISQDGMCVKTADQLYEIYQSTKQ